MRIDWKMTEIAEIRQDFFLASRFCWRSHSVQAHDERLKQGLHQVWTSMWLEKYLSLASGESPSIKPAGRAKSSWSILRMAQSKLICESFSVPARNIGTLNRGDLGRRMSTYGKMLITFLDCSMPTSDCLARSKLSRIRVSHEGKVLWAHPLEAMQKAWSCDKVILRVRSESSADRRTRYRTWWPIWDKNPSPSEYSLSNFARGKY